jgi:hypothetical protein
MNNYLQTTKQNLADSRLKEIHRNVKSRKNSVRYANNHNHKIRYIEALLQTSIPDHRKYSVRTILAPYLINIRKMSHEDALNIIRQWLGKCDKLCAAARVGYLPIGFSDLNTENRELADLISCQIK